MTTADLCVRCGLEAPNPVYRDFGGYLASTEPPPEKPKIVFCSTECAKNSEQQRRTAEQ